MPDIELILLNLTNTCLAYRAHPTAVRYYFEANILSWGFLNV